MAAEAAPPTARRATSRRAARTASSPWDEPARTSRPFTSSSSSLRRRRSAWEVRSPSTAEASCWTWRTRSETSRADSMHSTTWPVASRMGRETSSAWVVPPWASIPSWTVEAGWPVRKETAQGQSWQGSPRSWMSSKHRRPSISAGSRFSQRPM